MACLKSFTDCSLHTTTAGHTSTVDAFGNNVKKLKGAKGGGTTQNHNSFVDALSYWLGARASIPLQGVSMALQTPAKESFPSSLAFFK